MHPMRIAAGCTGKEKHLTFVEAERVAQRMRREQDLSVVAYHCRGCGYAHVGDDSTTNRQRRIDWLFRKRELLYAV